MSSSVVPWSRFQHGIAWILLVLSVGAVAVGFVLIRNEQVRAGHGLKAVEKRIAEREMEIELYEVRIARLKSRPSLTARLRERKSKLQWVAPRDVVRLPFPVKPTEEE